MGCLIGACHAPAASAHTVRGSQLVTSRIAQASLQGVGTVDLGCTQKKEKERGKGVVVQQRKQSPAKQFKTRERGKKGARRGCKHSSAPSGRQPTNHVLSNPASARPSHPLPPPPPPPPPPLIPHPTQQM
jgi:hypothetical protein